MKRYFTIDDIVSLIALLCQIYKSKLFFKYLKSWFDEKEERLKIVSKFIRW